MGNIDSSGIHIAKLTNLIRASALTVLSYQLREDIIFDISGHRNKLEKGASVIHH